jgi:hypothetical protein
VAFGLTILAAAGAIAYSHVSQTEERKIMRSGVERDKARMRQKKLERKRREEQTQQ